MDSVKGLSWISHHSTDEIITGKNHPTEKNGPEIEIVTIFNISGGNNELFIKRIKKVEEVLAILNEYKPFNEAELLEFIRIQTNKVFRN